MGGKLIFFNKWTSYKNLREDAITKDYAYNEIINSQVVPIQIKDIDGILINSKVKLEGTKPKSLLS